MGVCGRTTNAAVPTIGGFLSYTVLPRRGEPLALTSTASRTQSYHRFAAIVHLYVHTTDLDDAALA